MKEGQAHEAVLAMLRKFDEENGSARPKTNGPCLPLKPTNLPTPEDVKVTADRKKQDDISIAAVETKRNRRMAKFVEHLPDVEEMAKNDGGDGDGEDKALWRLSMLGPKIRTLERAPWEDTDVETAEAPSMLGPKIRTLERAPWEENEVETIETPEPMERSESQGLEDIMEDEEDTDTLAIPYQAPTDNRSKLLTPPVESTSPSSPTSYFNFSKSASKPTSVSTPPKSHTVPISPTSELFVPKTPPKSPSTIRSRAGLKKIFLSTLRPRKREDVEPPSPTGTLSSSAATTPSLPTPTIRISSPIHPRRMDGSPIYGDDSTIGPVSPVELKYKLPELRLSRADWGEWGRQIADRL